MALQSLSVPPLSVLDRLLAHRAGTDEPTQAAVASIIGRVREYGDEGVRACAREFDGLDLAPSLWELPRKDWDLSLQRLPGTLRAALTLAAERVRAFHEQQRDSGFLEVQADGTVLGTRVLPVDRVGLYVPGGKASYPSTVIMNAVPATVAGVAEIIVVTPPSEFLSDAVLAACALSGATRIFRVGGAQAVAALAYGTETIPRVDVIVGPGNRWVAEAKRQVVGLVGIDGVAGPTELLVLADDSADTHRVALDLVAQAEHDQDAVAWCVTTSERLAGELPAALDRVLATAPRAAIARAALERNGVVVRAPTLELAAEVVNLKAPEHSRFSPPIRNRRWDSFAMRERFFWATRPRNRSATTSPDLATCSQLVVPPAFHLRWGSTPSPSAPASLATRTSACWRTQITSLHWRKRRG